MALAKFTDVTHIDSASSAEVAAAGDVATGSLQGMMSASDKSLLAHFANGIGTLDGSGVFTALDSSATVIIGSWYGTLGAGTLYTQGAPLRLFSSAGAADAGLSVVWITM